MKEGRSSDSVEYISDESGDDVEEHGDQDKLSNFNEPESDHSGESPVLKRGRKRNRPLPAKQKPRPPIQLNLESIREKQVARLRYTRTRAGSTRVTFLRRCASY